MKTKHTKGEWFIQGKNLIKCENEQIASTNSMLDEYEANAKLIAAAPELLEALITIEKWACEFGMGGSEYEKVINAIKKATE